MGEQTKYKLAGKEYIAKKKYTLKEWGKIIVLSQVTESKNPVIIAAVLVASDNLDEMLGLILTEKVENELMDDDFAEVGRLLSDFFTRKQSMKNIGTDSSEISIKNTTPA